MGIVSRDLHPCAKPFWAPTGHSQTVLGFYLPTAPLEKKGEKFEIPLPDGDRLFIRYLAGTSHTIVYLLHGLGGDTNSNYMVRTARICQKLGHSVYLINHRGCGEGSKLAAKPYHSGRGEDYSEVIAWGRKRHPGYKHLAIGFSLGANALLCLLTGLRGETLPDYAISVNAPIDLKRCAMSLSRGFNLVYDQRFVREARSIVKDKFKSGMIQQKVRFPYLMHLRHFDDHYTAPYSGFRNAEDYYAQCSTHQHLHKITVPTLLMSSKNDPLVPVQSYETARLSSSVRLHLENEGGHIGYLHSQRTALGSIRWLDYALFQHIQSIED